jgi:hypothetical protein
MAVEFDASGEGINFGTSPNMESLTTLSISSWIYLKGYGYSSTNSSIMLYATDPISGFCYFSAVNGNIGVVVDNVLFFSNGFSGTAGWWYSAADSVAVNNWYHAVVTFDNTDAANNPSFYVNGVSKSVTEQQTPSGTSVAYTNASLYVGNYPGLNSSSMNGLTQDTRVYNRILSADEVAELYNSRMQNKILNGLVFWSRLDGAKGLQKFDGTTLTSANTFIDEIGGAVGVPVGSPIGRGNVIQRVK